MTRVVLQPAASAASRQHFIDTIDEPVDLEVAAEYLAGVDIDTLKAAHPSGAAMMWGAKPGERLQHVPKWKAIAPGDFILFAAKGKLFAAAEVTHTFRSKPLAELLWGSSPTSNGVDQTWELMFSIDSLVAIDVPYGELNAIVGRAPAAAVQEFNVVGEAASEDLLEHLNLASLAQHAAPTEGDYVAGVLAESFGPLEALVEQKRRLEQSFLRKKLLQGAAGTCALCGREFQKVFLTAAHIKRRSQCTDAEKLDFAAVAMLNCRFGCDELFGQGLVSVDQSGDIILSDELPSGPALDYATEHLAGKKCSSWNEDSEKYFVFHHENDFVRPIDVDAI